MGLLDRVSRALFGPPSGESTEEGPLGEDLPPEEPPKYGRLSKQKNLKEEAEPPGHDGEEPSEAPARIRGWGHWHHKIHQQFRAEPKFGNPYSLRRFKQREKRFDRSYEEAAAQGRDALIEWQRQQRRSPQSPFRRMMRTYRKATREGTQELEQRGASPREISSFERAQKARYRRVERMRGKFLTRSRKVTAL